MTEDTLYHDADLASFYDLDNEWVEDSEYCFEMAEKAKSVLDLACGTGLLAAAIAGEGKRVTGVDLSPAMLAIARARDGGSAVTFVEGDVRSLRLDQRFDLVTMTGHAFQCLLTREDRLAALKTIAAHLEDKGRFIFDSRNPAAEEWRDWTRDETERLLDHPRLGSFLAWNEVSEDPKTGIVTYETHYQNLLGTKYFQARSRIAFPDRPELEALMKEAGLKPAQWLGDWTGEAFTPGMPEFVVIGGRA